MELATSAPFDRREDASGPTCEHASNIVAAREEERRRIAGDLHDSITQLLFGALHETSAARRVVTSDPDRALARLGSVQQLLEESLGEMRRMVFELRPRILEECGLVVALERAALMLRRAGGPDVAFVARPGASPLPSSVEVVAYRLAQEALANVSKHARAQQVRVEIGWDEHALRLDVVDDGIGFDPRGAVGDEDDHLGLVSMRERIRAVDGTLDLRSAPGAGTRLHARIPLASPIIGADRVRSVPDAVHYSGFRGP